MSASNRVRPRAALLVFWYAAILFPTLVFKQIYVHSRYHRPLAVEAAALLGVKSSVVGRLATLFFFSREFLEVLLLVLAVYLVGHLLLRIRLGIAVFVSTFLLLVLLGANWLNLKELGEFLTPESFAIAVNWMRDNPEIVGEYVKGRQIAFLAVGLVWSALPILLERAVSARKRARTAPPPRDEIPGPRPKAGFFSPLIRTPGRRASTIFVALCLALWCGPPVLAPGYPPTLRGYWSSALFALAGLDEKEPIHLALVPTARLVSDFRTLAWPSGPPPASDDPAIAPAGERRPRHIVIVGLETAARKFYPIVDDPDLPHFAEMCRTAIVSRRHQTAVPFTTWATWAIVSGTYPPRTRRLVAKSDFETDGLGTVLARRGYETLFVDSYKINWHGSRYRRMLENLGFAETVDNSERVDSGVRSTFDDRVEAERRSLGLAEKKILDAASRGKKAFVFVSTTLGHYEWKSRPGDESLPGGQKLLGLCRVLDGLFGEFLAFLDQHGLRDEVILVVTGDHGLRNESEFASLGEPMRLGGPAFNVPLLIFAPGLLRTRVELPYPTSHVDLAPTLLEMCGISTRGLLLHGANVLDPRLADRLSFTMNTGLSPVDGFRWRDLYFTLDNQTGAMEVAGAETGSRTERLETALARRRDIPPPLQDPSLVLARANTLFDLTTYNFVSRRGKVN